MMYIILTSVLLYFIVCYFINSYFKEKAKEIQIEFFVASLYYEQLKHHMFQILELIYEKAADVDPEYVKDYEKIKISLNKRINEKGDEWVKNLNNTFGVNFKFNTWEELIKEADVLLKAVKTAKNKDESRKRD